MKKKTLIAFIGAVVFLTSYGIYALLMTSEIVGDEVTSIAGLGLSWFASWMLTKWVYNKLKE